MDATTAYRRRWATLAVLTVCLLVIGLDNTILNVALPSLATSLDAADSQLQWMVDSYTLVFAGLLLTAGSIGDRFGRRGALFSGLAIFGAASLWAAWSGSADQLIAARAAMGIGGALIMPSTLSVLTNTFTDAKERAKAIGIWAGASGLGIVLGPTLGGWLLEHFWWGSVFLVNVPIVLLAIVAGFWLVPESRDPAEPRIDLGGAVLSITGLSALVWSIIEAPARGWTSTADAGRVCPWRAAPGSVRRVRDPGGRADAQPRLLPQPPVRRRVGLGHPAVLRPVRHHLLPQPVPAVRPGLLGAGGRPAGHPGGHAGSRCTDRDQAGPTNRRTVGDPVRDGPGRGRAGSPGRHHHGHWIHPGSHRAVVIGFGMGLAMAPATEAVMSSLPKDKAGVGSAVNDTTRQIGGALGVAILGSILSSTYGNRLITALAERAPGLPVPEGAVGGIGGALAVAAQLPDEGAAVFADTAREAFIVGMDATVAVGAGVAALGAVLTMLLLHGRRHGRLQDVHADDRSFDTEQIANSWSATEPACLPI